MSKNGKGFRNYEKWTAEVKSRGLIHWGTGTGLVYATNEVPFGHEAERLFYGMYDRSVEMGVLFEEGLFT